MCCVGVRREIIEFSFLLLPTPPTIFTFFLLFLCFFLFLISFMYLKVIPKINAVLFIFEQDVRDNDYKLIKVFIFNYQNDSQSIVVSCEKRVAPFSLFLFSIVHGSFLRILPGEKCDCCITLSHFLVLYSYT